jgi:hypothetical protein
MQKEEMFSLLTHGMVTTGMYDFSAANELESGKSLVKELLETTCLLMVVLSYLVLLLMEQLTQ